MAKSKAVSRSKGTKKNGSLSTNEVDQMTLRRKVGMPGITNLALIIALILVLVALSALVWWITQNPGVSPRYIFTNYDKDGNLITNASTMSASKEKMATPSTTKKKGCNCGMNKFKTARK
ncbi:hypothetical protein [Sicyoidochytrium minutum DNA virus]|nr:hypothetical protein [Sicyoidochytrium minutum DNA virus]